MEFTLKRCLIKCQFSIIKCAYYENSIESVYHVLCNVKYTNNSQI